MHGTWERNIRYYRILRVIGDLFMIGPVWMPFCLNELHLNYRFIFWTEMLCVAIAVGGGVIIGTIGDRLGRRRSLWVGESLLLVGMVLLALARGGTLYLLSDVVTIFGFLFTGPALTSLLKDSLQRLNRAEEFRQEFGRANMWYYLAAAVGCIAAGLVASVIGARAVFAGQCLALLAALVLIGRLREPSWRGETAAVALGWRQIWRRNWTVLGQELKLVGRVVLGNGAVKSLMLFSAGSLVGFGFLFYVPYFRHISFPESGYGPVFAGYNLFCALVSLLIPWWKRRVSERLTFASILGGRIISWSLMALFAPGWGVVFILGEQFSRAMWEPYVSEFLYRHFSDQQRASAIAVNGFSQSAAKFFVLLMVGPLLDRVPFPVAIGSMLLIPILVGGAGLRRIWRLSGG